MTKLKVNQEVVLLLTQLRFFLTVSYQGRKEGSASSAPVLVSATPRAQIWSALMLTASTGQLPEAFTQKNKRLLMLLPLLAATPKHVETGVSLSHCSTWVEENTRKYGHHFPHSD